MDKKKLYTLHFLFYISTKIKKQKMTIIWCVLLLATCVMGNRFAKKISSTLFPPPVFDKCLLQVNSSFYLAGSINAYAGTTASISVSYPISLVGLVAYSADGDLFQLYVQDSAEPWVNVTNITRAVNGCVNFTLIPDYSISLPEQVFVDCLNSFMNCQVAIIAYLDPVGPCIPNCVNKTCGTLDGCGDACTYEMGCDSDVLAPSSSNVADSRTVDNSSVPIGVILGAFMAAVCFVFILLYAIKYCGTKQRRVPGDIPL